MDGLIIPEFVWVTSAVGYWTNPEVANALAERKAGIDGFRIARVARVKDNPFQIIDKDEFYERARTLQQVSMYGEISYPLKDETLNSDIVALSTDQWGAIYYSVYPGEKRDISYSQRRIVSEYEDNHEEPCPSLDVRYETGTRTDRDCCVLVAALIIGEVA